MIWSLPFLWDPGEESGRFLEFFGDCIYLEGLAPNLDPKCLTSLGGHGALIEAAE